MNNDPPVTPVKSKGLLPNWLKLKVVRHLRKGGIIAYPTEAVFGLGCDPSNSNAVQRLLALKRRAAIKGVILIASEFDQVADLVAVPDTAALNRILSPRPKPTTWVIPAESNVPSFLTGGQHGLAIRITSHPLASELCRAFGGPLVSTSANITGSKPAKTCLKIRQYFGSSDLLIVPGPLGAETQTSEIRDAVSGEKYR